MKKENRIFRYYRTAAHEIPAVHSRDDAVSYKILSGKHELDLDLSLVGWVLIYPQTSKATGEKLPNRFYSHVTRSFIEGLQGAKTIKRPCREPSEPEAMRIFLACFPEFWLPVPRWKKDEIVRTGELRWDIDDNSRNRIVYRCKVQHQTGFGKYSHRPGLDARKTDRFQIPWEWHTLANNMFCGI